jgi:phage tail-like protein
VSDPVNTMRFDVRIDGLDLGSFTALDGLNAEYEVKTYEEGGENGFVHQLPGRVKYTNIKLTRPVDLTSKALAAWFSSMVRGLPTRKSTAVVIAFNDNQEPIAQWALMGVHPVKYTGPSFSVDGARVATESIELAHEGFLLP